MSNTIKLYFHNEFYSSFKGRTDIVAEGMKHSFQNKLVFFPVDWNDYNYYTNFYMVFYGDAVEEIGEILICHKDLTTITNYQSNHKNKTITYLIEDKLVGRELDTEQETLGDDYFSCVSFHYFTKLLNVLDGLGKKDELKSILKFLREFGFIKLTDLELLKLTSYDWFKKSFSRYGYQKKMFYIHDLLNRKNIKEIPYDVVNNLEGHVSKLKNSDELYEWVNENDLTITEIKSIVDFIKKGKEGDLKDIEEEILLKFKNKLERSKRDEIISEVLKKIDELFENEEFTDLVENIMKKLEVKDGEIPNIGHYTTLTTLQKLIKKDEGTYLRLTNSKQLNDPLEGQFFFDFVFGEEKNQKKMWYASKIYVSSATTETDSLPMWKQYAEDTKGAMLVYDKEYLSSINKLDFVNICKVAYLDINNDNRLVDVFVDGKKDDDLKNWLNKIKDSDKNLLNEKNLRQMGYYFKKGDYSYEKEYRILIEKEKYDKWRRDQNVDVNLEYNDELEFFFLYIFLEEVELKVSRNHFWSKISGFGLCCAIHWIL